MSLLLTVAIVIVSARNAVEPSNANAAAARNVLFMVPSQSDDPFNGSQWPSLRGGRGGRK